MTIDIDAIRKLADEALVEHKEVRRVASAWVDEARSKLSDHMTDREPQLAKAVRDLAQQLAERDTEIDRLRSAAADLQLKLAEAQKVVQAQKSVVESALRGQADLQTALAEAQQTS